MRGQSGHVDLRASGCLHQLLHVVSTDPSSRQDFRPSPCLSDQVPNEIASGQRRLLLAAGENARNAQID